MEKYHGNPRRNRNNPQQVYFVEDLRDKLNRKRTEQQHDQLQSRPPPDPSYNFLKDPSRDNEADGKQNHQEQANRHHKPFNQPRVQYVNSNRQRSNNAASYSTEDSRNTVKKPFNQPRGQQSFNGHKQKPSNVEFWDNNPKPYNNIKRNNYKQPQKPLFNIKVKLSTTTGERTYTFDEKLPITTTKSKKEEGEQKQQHTKQYYKKTEQQRYGKDTSPSNNYKPHYNGPQTSKYQHKTDVNMEKGKAYSLIKRNNNKQPSNDNTVLVKKDVNISHGNDLKESTGGKGRNNKKEKIGSTNPVIKTQKDTDNAVLLEEWGCINIFEEDRDEGIIEDKVSGELTDNKTEIIDEKVQQQRICTKENDNYKEAALVEEKGGSENVSEKENVEKRSVSKGNVDQDLSNNKNVDETINKETCDDKVVLEEKLENANISVVLDSTAEVISNTAADQDLSNNKNVDEAIKTPNRETCDDKIVLEEKIENANISNIPAIKTPNTEKANDDATILVEESKVVHISEENSKEVRDDALLKMRADEELSINNNVDKLEQEVATSKTEIGN